MWKNRKLRDRDQRVWIWKYDRPFFEGCMFTSRAIFTGRVLEIYFNAKPSTEIDLESSRKEVSRALMSLFNARRCIRILDFKKGLLNVQFYCRLDSLPTEDTMAKVPAVIEEGLE